MEWSFVFFLNSVLLGVGLAMVIGTQFLVIR